MAIRSQSRMVQQGALIAAMVLIVGLGQINVSRAATTTGEVVVCANTRTGDLRQITKGKCRRTERILRLHSAMSQLATAGPQGAAGPQGPAGPQGAAGQNGIAGPQGQTGPRGPGTQWTGLSQILADVGSDDVGRHLAMPSVHYVNDDTSIEILRWAASGVPQYVLRMSNTAHETVRGTVTQIGTAGNSATFMKRATEMQDIGPTRTSSDHWRLFVTNDVTNTVTEYDVIVEHSGRTIYTEVWMTQYSS